MQQDNTNSEEIKQSYFQIKSSAVEHLRDLVHDLKSNKNLDLQDKIKELEEELENLKNTKKYGLVWDNEKEPEQVVLDCQNKLPILKEKKDKKIINDDSGESNILIQGDNYHALQVLSYTHKEAIDVIYIDPPYNTGGDDFTYNDKIIDKEDTYRHSKWLNFMSKRLNLAYDLLKEDGVIFISIDDNEQAQLKLLCNEIFGEENFIEEIIWKNKYGAGAKTKGFISIHEYILCYTKGKLTNIQTILGEKETSKHNKIDEKFDIRGGYRTQPLMTKSLGDRPNLVYPVIYDGYEIWPDKQWVWSKERMQMSIENNLVEFVKKKEGGYSIRGKQYLRDENGNLRKGKPLSIIDMFYTQEGSAEILNIFGKQIFAFPKPSSLIKYFLSFTFNDKDKKDQIILDFFAGSGTTGHAVLDLNKEDGGNRKFILCTNNENNICEEITYERIKRVSNGYTNSKGNEIAGLGGNLRYYETDFVEVDNLTDIDDEKKLELTYNAGELLAIKEGIYNELEKNSYGQIFENRTDIVAVYFKETAINIDEMEERLTQIQKQKGGKVIWYIYGNPYKKETFKKIKNLELKDIPDPILKVYREINKV